MKQRDALGRLIEWPREMEERLIALLTVDRVSAADAAAALAISKGAALGKAQRLANEGRIPQNWHKDRPVQTAEERERKKQERLKRQRDRGGLHAALTRAQTTIRATIQRAAPEPMNLGFRSSEGCQWPLWGNVKPTHLYCGKPRRAPSEPYCEECRAKAFVQRLGKTA